MYRELYYAVVNIYNIRGGGKFYLKLILKVFKLILQNFKRILSN
jgi:hypothetical protein